MFAPIPPYNLLWGLWTFSSKLAECAPHTLELPHAHTPHPLQEGQTLFRVARVEILKNGRFKVTKRRNRFNDSFLHTYSHNSILIKQWWMNFVWIDEFLRKNVRVPQIIMHTRITAIIHRSMTMFSWNLIELKNNKLHDYHPLKAQCLPLADLYHSFLTKELLKIHSAI